jgi:hypothetical protein
VHTRRRNVGTSATPRRRGPSSPPTRSAGLLRGFTRFHTVCRSWRRLACPGSWHGAGSPNWTSTIETRLLLYFYTYSPHNTNTRSKQKTKELADDTQLEISHVLRLLLRHSFHCLSSLNLPLQVPGDVHFNLITIDFYFSTRDSTGEVQTSFQIPVLLFLAVTTGCDYSQVHLCMEFEWQCNHRRSQWKSSG